MSGIIYALYSNYWEFTDDRTKKMKRLLLLSFTLLCIASFLFAGPFGTSFGMSVDELKKVGSLELLLDNRNYSTCLFTPKSAHSTFDLYLVTVGKTEGLVKVLAVTDAISDTGFGTKTKSTFGKIKESLTSLYGKPTNDFDYNTSKTWTDSDEWMMSLYLDYRVLAAFWNDVVIDNHRVSVGLIVEGESSTSSTIELHYESSEWAYLLNKERATEDSYL